MAVIILVVEAMGLRVCAFRSYSTLPVSMVSTIAAGELMAGAVAAEVAQVRSAYVEALGLRGGSREARRSP